MLKKFYHRSLKTAFALTSLSFCNLQPATFSCDNDQVLSPGSFDTIIKSVNAIYPGAGNFNKIIFGKTLNLQSSYPTFRQNVDFELLQGVQLELKSLISSTAQLKKSGAGFLQVNAPLNFSGNWELDSGITKLNYPQKIEGILKLKGELDVDHIGLIDAKKIEINANGSLKVNQSANIEIPISVNDVGDFSSPGQVVFKYIDGVGLFNLDGKAFIISDNQFSGTLKLNSGDLTIVANQVPSSFYLNGGNLIFSSKRIAHHNVLIFDRGSLIINQKVLGINEKAHVLGQNSNVTLNGNTFGLNEGMEGTGHLDVMGPGKFIFKNKNLFLGSMELKNLEFHMESFDSLSDITLDNVEFFIPKNSTLDRQTNIYSVNSGFRLIADDVVFGPILKGKARISASSSGSIILKDQPQFFGTWMQEKGHLKLDGNLKDLIIGPDASLSAQGSIQDLKLFGNQYLKMDSLNYHPELSVDKAEIFGTIVLATDQKVFDLGLYPIEKVNEVILNQPKVLAPVVFEGDLTFQNGTLYYDLKNIKKIADLIDVSKFDDLALGKSFDQTIFPVGSQIDDVLRDLLNLKSDQLAFKNAIATLQPAHFSALGLEQESNFMLARSSLNNRMQELLDFPCADDVVWDEDHDLWFDPVFDFTRQKSSQNDIGYYGSSYGAFLGYDFRIHRDVHVGASIGYTYSDVKWLKDVGSGLINSGYLSGYFIYRRPHFYLNGSIASGYSHYSATRHINFTKSKMDAQHKNHGFGYSADLEIGGRLGKKIQVQPFVRNSYIGLYQQDFTEHGAQDLDLKVKSKEFSMYRLETGFIFSRCRDYKNWAVSPELDLSFIYEKELATGTFQAEFAKSGIRYNVQGMKPTRYLFSPGFSIDTVYKKVPVMIGLRYHGEIGANFYDQRFSGHLGYSF